MNYPLGRVVDEANLVVERENTRIAQEAVLIQQAIITVAPGVKKNQRGLFTKTLNTLKVLVKPIGGSSSSE